MSRAVLGNFHRHQQATETICSIKIEWKRGKKQCKRVPSSKMETKNPPYLSGLVCAYHPAVQSLIPKYTKSLYLRLCLHMLPFWFVSISFFHLGRYLRSILVGTYVSSLLFFCDSLCNEWVTFHFALTLRTHHRTEILAKIGASPRYVEIPLKWIFHV